MRRVKWERDGCSIVTIFLSIMLIVVSITSLASCEPKDNTKKIFWEGRRSRMLGTPATANPYHGIDGAAWLDGWETVE